MSLKMAVVVNRTVAVALVSKQYGDFIFIYYTSTTNNITVIKYLLKYLLDAVQP